MICTRILIGGVLLTGLVAAAPAGAVSLGPSSGFLQSYINAHNPTNGDLDINNASATFTGSTFDLDATFNAAVGTTSIAHGDSQDVFYVWGIFRGSSSAASFAPVLPGVVFDALVVSSPDEGFTAVIDLINNPSGMTFLPAADTVVSGNSLDLTVPAALLPSLGVLNQNQFQVNLWPRFGLDPTQFSQIAEFDPPNSDIQVTTAAVPEPSTWAMLLAGFLGLGAMMRRARTPVATR